MIEADRIFFQVDPEVIPRTTPADPETEPIRREPIIPEPTPQIDPDDVPYICPCTCP